MTGTAHIFIFVNPFSKKAAAYSRWLELELTRRNKTFTIFRKDWPASCEGCSEAWVVGGDGTLNYFLNKYPQPAISLALFKAGTGNDFFHHLYGDPGQQQHLEKVLNSPPKPMDAATCNGRLYINQAGFGFDGEVLKSMNTIRLLGNFLGYYLMVIKHIFLYREPVIRIVTGGKTLERKLLLAFVSNASQTGGGFKVNPAAEHSDGRLDLLSCKPLSIFKRLVFLPKIRQGRHLEFSFIDHSLVKEVCIECDREIAGQLDGELIRGRSFNCKILPAYLNMKF